MPHRAPEVVSGARGPRAEVREKGVAAEFSTGLSIPAGKRVFQAKADRYRLQLTSPAPQRLPDGRILDPEKAVVVVFKDWDGGYAVLDIVKDAFAIGEIEKHRDYLGNGGADFWDFAGVLAQRERSVVDLAVAAAASATPEARARILDALLQSEGSTFALPKPNEKIAEPVTVQPAAAPEQPQVGA